MTFNTIILQGVVRGLGPFQAVIVPVGQWRHRACNVRSYLADEPHDGKTCFANAYDRAIQSHAFGPAAILADLPGYRRYPALPSHVRRCWEVVNARHRHYIAPRSYIHNLQCRRSPVDDSQAPTIEFIQYIVTEHHYNGYF
jgi:hypothetical protein